jgi:hypothetical protein
MWRCGVWSLGKYAISLTGSSGGVTGTEVASVGEYALSGESCEELDAFVSLFWASWESGLEAILSVAPLTEGQLGSLSGTPLSTMGVRARCIASGPDKAKAWDGGWGREVNPLRGIPVAGSSVEGIGGSVADALEFDSFGATF